MATDLGNLSLGLEIPGLAMLNTLDAQLRLMEATPHVIAVNIATPNIRAGFGGAFQQEMAATAASTGQAEQAVASFGRTTAASAAEIDTASVALKGMEGSTKGVITGLLGISGAAVGILAAGAAIAIAAKSAADFQQSMANLQAVLHASPTDLSGLGAGIQESSRTSVFSITQIADADTILAKSGADANAIMREQADVLNLASASNTSASNAAAGMVTAQKDFGLTAKDSTAVANDLSRAVDSSVGTFQDMTDALKQVGPVAQQAGLSLQDTTTAIAALENAGLQGDTGAGLKIFLQRLEAPTSGAKKAIDDLGLSIYDTDGKMRSLADIADQLRLKTEGLSDEAKNADLTQIFGARGVRVADIFAESGSDGLQAVAQHEAELGTAADIAQTKLDTLTGQMKELKSSGDTVAANFGGVLVPALTAAGSEFTDLLNSVTKITSGLADTSAAGTYGQQISDAVRSAINAPIGDQPFTQAQQRSNLIAEQQALQDQIAQLQPGVDASKGDILGHLLGDDGGKAKLDQAKEGLAQVNAEIAKLDPATLASQGLQKLSSEEANLANEFSRGQITMDQATASAQSWSQTALASGADTAKVTGSLVDFNTALKNIADAQYEAQYIALQTMQTERDKAKQLLDEGAPANLVETAIFGKGLGVDPATLLEQQAELASWEKTYAAEQASAKQNDAAQLASAKQRIADEATADKAALTEKTATQTAAAQAVEQAWNSASSAISGLDKRLDGAAAISTLSGINDQLHATEAALAAVGQDSPHLDALTGLSDIFKGITDQTDKASEALNAYNLTLSNTNKAIQEIGTLKSEYMAALDAAQKRVANGTADASDMQIIAARQSVLGTLNSQTSGLQQAANQDILGQIANLPNYSALDANARSTLAANGGAQHILLTITTNADAAQQEIKDKLLQAKQMQIDIKTNAAEVQTQIDAIAKARTADLTIVTHFTDDQGHPTVNPTLDPARGYGEPQAGSGVPNQYAVPPGGGASTMTPRGDAANLMPYADLIQQAAAAYGVPAWVLGAIIEHESGGTVGDVQPGGLGRGLTQVDIGQNPQYDEKRLTGTSRSDAAYQINAGAEIFANFLKQYGGDFQKALQNYAGPAYQSQEGGGVPAGLPLPEELQRYYRAPVEAALTPYSTSAAGGIGASTGTGTAAGDAALGVGGALFGQGTPSASGGTSASILAAAQSHIGQQLDDFGKTVNGKCEEIVDDILAQTGKGVTDFRANSSGADHATADAHIRAAMAGVPGAGTVIPASQARPGDEVGWLGTSAYAGDPAGHIGILSQVGQNGPSQYIGTSGQGVIARPLGPDAIFIRPDGVVAAGPEPGTTVAKAPTGGAAGVPPNINGTTGGTPIPAAIPPDFSKAAEDLSVALSKLDPAALKDAGQQFTTILPALTKMQEDKISTDPANLTATDKQNALNAATQQGLQYETDYANLVRDIESHTGNIKDDVAKISADVGGPMAAGFGAAALASAQLAASQDQITKLQEQQKQADAAQQQVVAARTLADQADSRLQTIAGWGQQTLQNQLADKQTAETTAYTEIQRQEQDRQRQLQFSQQVQATDLQNSLTDLQKQQQNTVYQRTSQEQLQLATANAAPTAMAGGRASAVLAAMHDQDLAQKDLNTKAIDGIQLQIREQAKAANLDSYNLQTETIAAQRKHEDAMAGFTAEGTALSRQQQQAAINHTIAQWQLQDTRAAEDKKYQAAKDANTTEQAAETAIGKAAQANLDLANQALSVWQQTGAVVSLAAQQIPSLMQAVYTAQTAGLSTKAGVPYGQFPAPGQSHATGGSVGGWGIVGDSPGGDMSYAEAVFGTYTVVPHNESVRRGLVPGGGGNGGGMTVNLNLGDVGLALSDADKKEINAFVTAKLNAARAAGVNRTRAAGQPISMN